MKIYLKEFMVSLPESIKQVVEAFFIYNFVSTYNLNTLQEIRERFPFIYIL